LDNFDGSVISSDVWSYISNPGMLSLSGGFLNADGPPTPANATLGSRSVFRGDGEFILDFRYFSTTATTCSDNWANIALKLSEAPGSAYVYISRMWCGNHGIVSDGSGVPLTSITASPSSGLLKIARTGSTVTTSYNDNEGSGWVPIATYALSGDLGIQLSASTGDNGHIFNSQLSILKVLHRLSSYQPFGRTAIESEGGVRLIADSHGVQADFRL